MAIFTASKNTSGDKYPGQFGSYYLHELINSGGMADLWLATNPNKETVAIRKLHGHLKFDFQAKRRFARGCEVLAKIHNHQHVIGYVEHGKIGGVPFLAMEYLEGTNLKILEAQGDPMLSELVGALIIDMALALEHVHDSGFMHLDFKPENIMISRSGALRLVDFDLAQPIPERPKKFSKNPGTPAYMAPEQLLRRPYDHRVDLFSYGVTIYELLTGRKPFPGDTPDEILRRQLDRSEFVKPREINEDIPAALERTIIKLIEKDPDQRYPFMSVVTRDVQAALYV